MANCCANSVCPSEFRLLNSGALPAYGQPVTKPSGEGDSYEHDLHL